MVEEYSKDPNLPSLCPPHNMMPGQFLKISQGSEKSKQPSQTQCSNSAALHTGNRKKKILRKNDQQLCISVQQLERRLGENYSEVSVEIIYRLLTTDVKTKLEQRYHPRTMLPDSQEHSQQEHECWGNSLSFQRSTGSVNIQVHKKLHNRKMPKQDHCPLLTTHIGSTGAQTIS